MGMAATKSRVMKLLHQSREEARTEAGSSCGMEMSPHLGEEERHWWKGSRESEWEGFGCSRVSGFIDIGSLSQEGINEKYKSAIAAVQPYNAAQ